MRLTGSRRLAILGVIGVIGVAAGIGSSWAQGPAVETRASNGASPPSLVAQQGGSRPDSARIRQGAVIELRSFTRELGQLEILRHAPEVQFTCEQEAWPYCFGFDNGGLFPGAYGTQSVDRRTADENIPRFMRSTFDRMFRRHFTRLDDAQKKLPGDGWIAGQRVFHQVERGDVGRARAAATTCRAERWWCAALVGYVAYAEQQFVRADSAFAVAVAEMPELERCEWENLADLVDGDDDAEWYERLSCADRQAVNDTIWWLSDPLYAVAGNERRTAHYHRLVYGTLAVDYQSTNPPDDFRIGDRPRLPGSGREMPHGAVVGGRASGGTSVPAASGGSPGDSRPRAVARRGAYHPFSYVVTLMGTPSHTARHQMIGTLLLFEQPLSHFIPDLAAARAPLRAAPTDWSLDSKTAKEYHRSRFGAFGTLEDYQLAYFRRGDTTRLVAAADVDSDTLLARASLVGVSVVLSAGPRAALQIEKTSIPERDDVWVLDAPRDSTLVSIEAVGAGIGAARVRLAAGPPSMPGQRITLSDLLLLDYPLPLVTELDSAIVRAAPNIRVPHGGRVGLFWEIYGTESGDSITYAVSTAERRSASVLGRVGRALGVLSSDSTRVQWVEHRRDRAAYLGQGVTLDISELGAGRHVIRLEARVPGQQPVSVTREIEVVGPGRDEE